MEASQRGEEPGGEVGQPRAAGVVGEQQPPPVPGGPQVAAGFQGRGGLAGQGQGGLALAGVSSRTIAAQIRASSPAAAPPAAASAISCSAKRADGVLRDDARQADHRGLDPSRSPRSLSPVGHSAQRLGRHLQRGRVSPRASRVATSSHCARPRAPRAGRSARTRWAARSAATCSTRPVSGSPVTARASSKERGGHLPAVRGPSAPFRPTRPGAGWPGRPAVRGTPTAAHPGHPLSGWRRGCPSARSTCRACTSPPAQAITAASADGAGRASRASTAVSTRGQHPALLPHPA